MIKQFSLVQLFSIADGRMSTNMGDIYEMLNHICDDDLMIHHLPVANSYLKEKNPKWLVETIALLISLGVSREMEFQTAFEIVKANDRMIDVPQLKDEFDVSDFGAYMADNSLLKTIGSKTS